MTEIQVLPFTKEDKQSFLPKLVPLHQLSTCEGKSSTTDIFFPLSLNFNFTSCDDKKIEVTSTKKENNEEIQIKCNWSGVSTQKEQKATKVNQKQTSKPQFTKQKMQKFPSEQVSDFKHVIYNLLVDFYNGDDSLCEPITINDNGKLRQGFRFNENMHPEKKLPELYAVHVRNAKLDKATHSTILIQDLYKFYLRAGLELLAKYFEKYDRWTFLYEDNPLFIPGASLSSAEDRMRSMKSRARKKQRTSDQ